jgi:adenine-specific DNA-methyltransferase
VEIVPKKVNNKKSEQKIQDALNILSALGLPRQQLNERSALTLLSLLALEPETVWDDASDPLMGITPMMDFFFEHYGKK